MDEIRFWVVISVVREGFIEEVSGVWVGRWGGRWGSEYYGCLGKVYLVEGVGVYRLWGGIEFFCVGGVFGGG